MLTLNDRRENASGYRFHEGPCSTYLREAEMYHKVRISVVPLLAFYTVLAIIVTGCCISGCRSKGNDDAKLTSLTTDTLSTGLAAVTNATLLSWDTPTTYTDGSSPLDIGLYKVYFSISPSPRSSGIFHVVYPPATSVKVRDVVSQGTGIYNFVVTAVDTSGIESDPSNPVSKYLY